jgi:hypothetical protein
VRAAATVRLLRQPGARRARSWRGTLSPPILSIGRLTMWWTGGRRRNGRAERRASQRWWCGVRRVDNERRTHPRCVRRRERRRNRSRTRDSDFDSLRHRPRRLAAFCACFWRDGSVRRLRRCRMLRRDLRPQRWQSHPYVRAKPSIPLALTPPRTAPQPKSDPRFRLRQSPPPATTTWTTRGELIRGACGGDGETLEAGAEGSKSSWPVAET